jgi:O-antigen chain-terminating methyltransferase
VKETQELSVGADVDVRKLMEDIRAEVERKRRAGLYPPSVLEELDFIMAGESADESIKSAMLLLRQSALFSTDVSTASKKGLAAPAAAAFKKAVKGSTSWYVSGILQQVDLFAAHAIRVIGLLSERIRHLEERIPEGALEELQGRLEAGERERREMSARLDGLESHAEVARPHERIPILERSIRGLRERLESAATEDGMPVARVQGLGQDLALDYLDFENRFRGSEEAIRDKQHSYTALFKNVQGPVVDLGCGRGEFLELLAEAGIQGYGVDRHPDMIDLCREKGFQVDEADVLEHLASVPAQSLGGIFCAQMIEHLDVKDVPRFFDLAADALAPGGHLVVETINPESLFVFSAAFYVDLGHLRPLHPLTLRFIAEKVGFAEVRIEYLSPPPPELRPEALDKTGEEHLDGVIDDVNRNFQRLDDVVFGPQDYALVARR